MSCVSSVCRVCACSHVCMCTCACMKTQLGPEGPLLSEDRNVGGMAEALVDRHSEPLLQGCGKALGCDVSETMLFADVVSAVLLGLYSVSLPSSPSPYPPQRKTVWEGEAFPSALLALCPSTVAYYYRKQDFSFLCWIKSLN